MISEKELVFQEYQFDQRVKRKKDYSANIIANSPAEIKAFLKDNSLKTQIYIQLCDVYKKLL